MHAEEVIEFPSSAISLCLESNLEPSLRMRYTCDAHTSLCRSVVEKSIACLAFRLY